MPAEAAGADVYIVTVPTPVDEANRPDLRPVIGASTRSAKLLDGAKRPIVVYESTVYPGVTEEICGPILEQESGLVCGEDFFLGYSPERINPGDKVHTVDKIIKVIAGQTPEVTEKLAGIYGAVTSAGVFRAASIKAAEAAKVIENAQRDINIAFMNEITQIFAQDRPVDLGRARRGAAPSGISCRSSPAWSAATASASTLIISATARRSSATIRRSSCRAARPMTAWAHGSPTACTQSVGGKAGTALVLGLTFKENVPDLRNSRVVDVIRRLEQLGHDVTVHDPRADPAEARHEYGIALDGEALGRRYDLVFAAVPHEEYKALGDAAVTGLAADGGVIADLKGIWRGRDFGGVRRWSL